MKLPTKLVAVKKITSPTPRSGFPVGDIEEAADLLIAAEGTINPLILRRTSFDTYEVVDGHFDYHAAVRAREKAHLQGEMIQAIVIEPENEASVLAQVELRRKRGAAPSVPVAGEDNPLAAQFLNLEQIVKNQFEELRKQSQRLDSQLAKLASSQPSTPNLNDEIIEKIVGKVVEALRPLLPTPRSTKSKRAKATLEELKASPLNINQATAAELQCVDGIGPKLAQRIVDLRSIVGSFKQMTDLIKADSQEQGKNKQITQAKVERHHWADCFVFQDQATG